MNTPSPLDEVEDVLQGAHDYIVSATRRLIPAHPKTPTDAATAELREQVASFAARLDAWNAEIEGERFRRMSSLLSESERRIVEESTRKRRLEIVGLLDQLRAAMQAQEELMERRAQRRARYAETDIDPDFVGELTEGDGK